MSNLKTLEAPASSCLTSNCWTTLIRAQQDAVVNGIAWGDLNAPYLQVVLWMQWPPSPLTFKANKVFQVVAWSF